MAEQNLMQGKGHQQQGRVQHQRRHQMQRSSKLEAPQQCRTGSRVEMTQRSPWTRMEGSRH
jgi:hypothetical protein